MKLVSKFALLLAVFAMLLVSGCSEKEKALVTAVKDGNTTQVQSLLDQGEDPNLKAKDGKTVLMLAAYQGHTDVAKILIDKGADVNAKDKDGKTALMYAAQQGYIDVARLLLENGADINAVDNNGKTALQIAQDNNQTKMVEFLKNWGKKSTPAPEAPAPVTVSSKQLSSVYFDFDQAALRADQAGVMNDNLKLLKENNKMYVIVIGHADQWGDRDYNQSLSERRAQTIKKYFVDNGIAADRVVVYAFGEDHPLKKGQDSASWSANRRVDVLKSDNVLSKEQVLTITIKD
ncbi:ankyrin repeat domain-containing protein [Acetonema longum]|uniref:Ankyrin n=1 Tax=Acetonema longum DSM 6540 TaxID=1009370 RepID=F7NG61_9FIRM|nr:ankyrin repeat domain-containing protein [Acetonema longum]EGO64979.1 Ankyrin [Acetonema longum DSM 6540]